MTKPMIKKVCETCGSDDVFIDAYADWDADTQSWELCATYDASWCAKCDSEINIIDKPADQLKGNV